MRAWAGTPDPPVLARWIVDTAGLFEPSIFEFKCHVDVKLCLLYVAHKPSRAKEVAWASGCRSSLIQREPAPLCPRLLTTTLRQSLN